MSRIICSRSGWILNALLLCVNVVLLSAWFFTWFLPQDRFATSARKGAAEWGMELYCAKRPFMLAVGKDFPRDQTFALFEHHQPFMLHADYEEQKGTKAAKQTIGATLGVVPSFAVSFAYDPTNPREVFDLRFRKGDATLYDFNADGIFDMRNMWSGEPNAQLWYKDKWQEMDTRYQGGGPYQRRLAGGEVLVFDMKSGLWHPAVDKPVSGTESGKKNP